MEETDKLKLQYLASCGPVNIEKFDARRTGQEKRDDEILSLTDGHEIWELEDGDRQSLAYYVES